MSDIDEHSIEVLNHLYAAERRSLLPRLAEVRAFVSLAHAGEIEQVRRMIDEEARHVQRLLEAAEACGGSLGPASADVHTAHLHYLDLSMLMPLVLASLESLVQTCAQALGDPSLAPKVAETVARIGNQHQVHVEQLRQIAAHVHAAQPT